MRPFHTLRCVPTAQKRCSAPRKRGRGEGGARPGFANSTAWWSGTKALWCSSVHAKTLGKGRKVLPSLHRHPPPLKWPAQVHGNESVLEGGWAPQTHWPTWGTAVGATSSSTRMHPIAWRVWLPPPHRRVRPRLCDTDVAIQGGHRGEELTHIGVNVRAKHRRPVRWLVFTVGGTINPRKQVTHIYSLYQGSTGKQTAFLGDFKCLHLVCRWQQWIFLSVPLRWHLAVTAERN